MSKLVVISGPSGVGKGTMINKVMEKYKEENRKIYLSISCTTRNPREGEIEGISYYFITEEEFLKRVEENDFLEYNKYGTGKYYGTPKSTVVNYLKDGYDVILEIDVNGYKQIKKNYPDAVGIFVKAPDLEELKARLINRGTETMDVVEQRINTAKEELKSIDEYDYVITNYDGKLEESTNELINILGK